MAEDYYISYFLFIFFIKGTGTRSFYFNLPDDHKNFTMHSHLKFENVSKYCLNRDNVCRSNNTVVCGLKVVKEMRFYKDFENSCYLFMSNMCDHPQEEYFIASAGTCEILIERRRNEEEVEPITSPDYETGNITNSTDIIRDNDNNTASESPGLRDGTTFSTLYVMDTSFDYHICPYSCPNVYSPVCINVNRGTGKYFKMMTFVNHCEGDVYYCKYPDEFAPPPGEDEAVRGSALGWSYCGASRYLQFARFAETTSSMGHYGWLKGDYKYSHIMEPHQRVPGYG